MPPGTKRSLGIVSPRGLVAGVTVVACGIVGFVVGWSSLEDGGIENYYRSGFIGLAGRLLLGLVLIVATKAVFGRRPGLTRR